MKGATRVCDFCSEPAQCIGQTRFGIQAFMCPKHFEKYGVSLVRPLSQTQTAPTKICSLCGEEKPLEEFYKYRDARGKERFRTECKTCNLAERKAASFRRR